MSINNFFQIEYTKIDNKIKEDTSCWILDYSPEFKNLLLPVRICEPFYNFVKDKNIPLNFNINGVKGCGKKTIINCILKYCFGYNIFDLNIHPSYDFIKSYNNIYYTDFQKLSKTELNQCFDYIKSLSKNKSIDGSYKVFVISHIDKISKLTQKIISNIMEKSVNNIRFITTTINVSKLSQDLLSRITNLRLPFMDENEFKQFTKQITKNNNTKINSKIALKIYKNNFYNLRETILLIQQICSQNESKYESPIVMKYVLNMLKYCIEDNYNNYIILRNKIYGILGLGFSASYVIKVTLSLMIKNKKVNNTQKASIIKLANDINVLLTKADRQALLLEKFFYSLIDIL